MHSFREKLCLIQFESGGQIALIDPLADIDLAPLADYLQDAEVWVHGGDFDMLMLKRAFGEVPKSYFDTQIAARLLGYQKFGLAAMIEDVFGVELSKSSQRADWGKRPLTDKMLDYAANDVRYVRALAANLLSRLDELDRREWFAESCETAREDFLARPEKSEDDQWRITGWGKLPVESLVFLRALWRWRAGEAERLDRPAFKITGNDVLLKLADELGGGGKGDAPRHLRDGQRRRLWEAVETARQVPRSEWPAKKRRGGGGVRVENEDEFKRLRAERNRVAEKLGIDPSLLATRATLESLSVSPEDAETKLMKWQYDLIHPFLTP